MYKPELEEFAPYYATYIDLIENKPIADLMEEHLEENIAFFSEIEDENWNYTYREGKWTIKQVLAHIVDTEWIFNARAKRFSRGDLTPLPGYDQDLYISKVNYTNYKPEELLDEFYFVRKASIQIFSNLTDKQLQVVGNADGKDLSVRAIGFILLGHPLHHIKIIKQKYL